MTIALALAGMICVVLAALACVCWFKLRLERQLREQEQRSSEALRVESERHLQTLVDGALNRFQVAAGDQLKSNGDSFRAINLQELERVLKPFRETLVQYDKSAQDSQKKVDDLEKRLQERMRMLGEAAEKFTTGSTNFVNAITGGNKVAGNWGEAVLDQLLESCGLVRDVHYIAQAGGTGNIPDYQIFDASSQKILVVDSKVSWKKYKEMSDSNDPAVRADALREHVESIHRQIDSLSSKNYPANPNPPRNGYQYLPFAAMFIPSDAALWEAVKSDPSIPEYAYRKHVVLVTPTSLFGFLRLIHEGWSLYNTQKNQEAIAHEANLVVERIDKLFKNLEEADAAYVKAHEKLLQATKLASSEGQCIRTPAQKIITLQNKSGRVLKSKTLLGVAPSASSVVATAALLVAAFFAPAEGVASDCFLECEGFAEKGGWVVDAQFMDQMGSPYLLAHGLGQPVADATTSFTVSHSGRYHVWARTKNWTAHWSSAIGAGRFQIHVDGTPLNQEFGMSGTADWRWEKAGEVELVGGKSHTLALHDLTGFEGRCDAVCLTRAARPPTARPTDNAAPAKTVSADLVVCGGGVAGICTAVTAARLGLAVALVEARPILGGANSSEVRVHLGGLSQLPPYPALGDVLAEFSPAQGGNAEVATRYEDNLKAAIVAAETNITLFCHTRITAADVKIDKVARHVASAIGTHAITGERTRFVAPLFVDATGDGALAFLAGADYRMGRESRAETGETMAVDAADKMTMGASVQWYAEKGTASVFPIQPWMLTFDEKTCSHGMRGDWNWETGMNRDQISEFERIRDYGMLVAYSNWAYLKSSNRRKYRKWTLAWMAYVAGKRESRRILGDHVLTQNDVFDFVEYPDGTCPTTWPIDLHFPKPIEGFPGESFRSSCTHEPHYAYPIPYRCFYSRNVRNLFMAGRNISVTHVALGTVRVMRTTGMMGEVVGRAASLCKRHGCLPRDIYSQHLDELKTLLGRSMSACPKRIENPYNGAYMLKGTPKKR